MQGGRAAAAAQGFTAEDGHLGGYEGGRRGPSHPQNADPGLARGDMEIRTPYLIEWKINKVAKVNSYCKFGLAVEFGTWRLERER